VLQLLFDELTGGFMFPLPARALTVFSIVLVWLSPVLVMADGQEAKVDAIFAGATAKTPGASVLIVQDGRVLYKAGYGAANVDQGITNAPDTRFHLASVTKQFTAAAVLQLHDRGVLNLDDLVSKYLPDFTHGAKMTIADLLHHTAGVPDFISYDQARNAPLECEPGERLNYSNTGYQILGRIIEKVSNRSYGAYLKENIFNPLGMKNSGLEDFKAGKRATGYLLKPADRSYYDSGIDDASGAAAAGGLYSTVEDMLLWDRTLNDETLLKRETIERAFAPATLKSGRKTNYGFGWMISERRGLREIGHGGDITGFNTYIARYPDQKFTVIVLSNAGMRPPGPIPTAGEAAHKIADIYLEDQMEPVQELTALKLDPTILARYVGEYELQAPQVIIDNSGKVFKITLEDGKLMGESKIGKDELMAVAETVFESRGGPFPIVITFESGPQGTVRGLVFSIMGVREFPAVKTR
jgi:CubicO group peptidase (beta-lactamase class C family)